METPLMESTGQICLTCTKQQCMEGEGMIFFLSISGVRST